MGRGGGGVVGVWVGGGGCDVVRTDKVRKSLQQKLKRIKMLHPAQSTRQDQGVKIDRLLRGKK